MPVELITLGIIAVLILMGLVFWVQSKRKKITKKDQERLRKEWRKIEKELEQNPQGAVMEADKVLNEALDLKGFSGSVGEKLKAASGLFSNINHVWSAHKLRNRMAHELNATVTMNEARNALDQFRKAIDDLGIKL